MSLRIEAIDNPLEAGCPCCGEGGLRGFVYDGEEPHSVYFAESGGMGAKPVVLIGVATGRWASDAPVDERACFVFACSKTDKGLESKPTIPYLLAFPEFKQLGAGVEPDVASEHALYARAIATLDIIIEQDTRLAHLRSQRSRFSAD